MSRKKRICPQLADVGMEQKFVDDLTFQNYYNMLVNLAINRFKFKNVPNGLNMRYFMLTQFYMAGSVLFYDDIAKQFVNSRFRWANRVDVYGEPISWEAVAPNGYHRRLDASNSAIVWDNYLRMPMAPTLRMYAYRLWEVQRAIDVNSRQQTNPVIVKSPQRQNLSIQNILQKVQGGEWYIWADPDLDLELQMFNTVSEFKGNEYHMLIRSIFDEALQFIGISTMTDTKRERLLQREAQANLGPVMAARSVSLNSTQEGFNKFNWMFGTDLQVEFNDEYKFDTDVLLNNPNAMQMLGGGINNV